MLLFVRFALHGEVVTQFVGVNNVDTADASSIKHAIDDVVERYLDLPANILMAKLVGFGSDGAAVMTGVNNGVVRLFRNDQSCMLGIHSSA